jgi:hypothetical protein
MRVYEVRGFHEYGWVNAHDKLTFSRLRAVWDGLPTDHLGSPASRREPVSIDMPSGHWVATDCPYFAADPLLLSTRAAEALRPHLAGAGLLLPTSGGPPALGYQAFFCERVLGAIDFERSDVTLFNDGGDSGSNGIWKIRRLELRPEVIGTHSVFRFARLRSRTYCTDAFVAEAERHGLVGFQFTEIWSSATGGVTVPPIAHFATLAEERAHIRAERAALRARLVQAGRDDLLSASPPATARRAAGGRGHSASAVREG